ncbi:MAG: CAP domain-containing protein [Agathobacter sp.]|nr:CAP domain-containing protein [Agathobacter sp.]
MKRIFALVLAFLLVFSMVGCDEKPTQPTNPKPNTHETESTKPTTPKPTEPKPTECPHQFVADKTIDPTCEKEGYTVYVCALCNKTENRDKTAKLNHAYTSQVTAPTTTAQGYTTHTCELCGHSYKDNYTDKLTEGTKPTEHTHKYTDTIVKPTCTTEGYTNHKCSCGESYNDTKVAATGHKYTDKVVNPTCTTEGYTTHTCSQCKNVYKDSTTKKLGHNYTSKVVAPTKTSQGYTVHTCTRCNHSYKDNYKDPVPEGTKPTEHTHSYTSKVTAPTCTAEGYTTHTCSCGDSYVDSKTAKAAHQYQDTKTDATCTAEGYTTHKCKVCGSAYTDTKVPALGHKYTDTVVKPTCDAQGYTQHKCDRCGKTNKDTYTSATGHAYSFTSDTATCTKAGTITETCGNCGKTKTTNSPAKGHGETTTKVVTEASCQKQGKTQTICTVCNTVLSESTTPKGTCHYVTENAGKVAEYILSLNDASVSHNAFIMNWGSTVKVDVCYGCCDVKNPRIAYDGASEMLGYVNELRRSVGVDYGVDLELDSACVALAQLRAKEIYSNFSHAGMRTPSGFSSSTENIIENSNASPYDMYQRWYNSSGHYYNMIEIGWTHFGYGAYLPSDAIERGSNRITAVQIFAW